MNREKSSARTTLRYFALSFILFACCQAAQAQTTAFTYQGKLTDAGATANGTYDFQVTLFDAATGGGQVGTNSTTTTGMTVTNGVFTVQLDFGAAAFPGPDRYLEISVKKPSETTYTTLTPRQRITSTPYALRALSAATADTATSATTATNADKLGNVAASQYVVTTDSRLSDARQPTAGSSNYIQNTTTQQTANFNISGNGVVGGKVGVGATSVPTSASLQVNGGMLARGGAPGSGGVSNNGYSFTGNSGDNDSGMFSTANGTLQLYVDNAERIHLTQGIVLTAGNGSNGGTFSPGGNGAGITLQAGNGGSGDLTGGAGAGITLQAGNGGNGTSGPGAGASITLQPGSGGSGLLNGGASGNVLLAPTNGNVGVGTTSPSTKLHVAGGTLRVDSLGTAGATSLCRNSLNEIANCSSSLRYKTNLQPFAFGLSLIARLQPISFEWKAGGMKDIGFGAEDVAQLNPLFVTYNAKGEVEGVKYDRFSVLFVNAFKEQQAQIQQQQQQIERQQQQLDELKAIVCELKPKSAVCH